MTQANKLSYVGFSQGTAQAFAALSIHPRLNEKINVFIALAPAMSPPGLAAPIVDGLMKASYVCQLSILTGEISELISLAQLSFSSSLAENLFCPPQQCGNP